MDAVSFLPPATYQLSASAAIARALHFSMPASYSDPCSSSSQLLADLGPGGGGHWFASAPTASGSKRMGPRAGGAGKPPQRRAKKRRPSKRAPTTFISTDPANFRFMVQHVTGAHHADTVQGFLSPASSNLLLPAPYGGGTFGGDDGLLVAEDGTGACFPTLDSGSVIYDDQI